MDFSRSTDQQINGTSKGPHKLCVPDSDELGRRLMLYKATVIRENSNGDGI